MIARASVEWHRLVENRDWLRTGSSNKNFIPRTAEIAFGKYWSNRGEQHTPSTATLEQPGVDNYRNKIFDLHRKKTSQ